MVSWKLAALMKLSLDSDAFVMPSSSVRARAGLPLRALPGSLPSASAVSLASFHSVLSMSSPAWIRRAARLGDDDLLPHRRVGDLEAAAIDDFARQERRVAVVFDLHLPQHLRQDDLDVLVVDRHALAAVDVLHFRQQVRVKRLFALDAEDVVRDDAAADERVAGLDRVAGVDEHVRALRHVVLTLHARLVLDDDRDLALAAALLDLDDAADLAEDRRLLRLAGLEELGDAGQTTGDVHRAGRLPAADGPACKPAGILSPSLTSIRARAGR